MFFASDLLWPSCCSLIINIPILVLVLSAFILYAEDDWPSSCGQHQRDEIWWIMFSGMLLWILAVLLEFLAIWHAATSGFPELKLFQYDRLTNTMGFSHSLISVGMVFLTLFGTIRYHVALRDDCFTAGLDGTGDWWTVGQLVQVVGVCTWIMALMWCVFAVCNIQRHSMDDERREAKCTQFLTRLFFCCIGRPRAHEDVIGSISTLFSRLLSTDEITRLEFQELSASSTSPHRPQGRVPGRGNQVTDPLMMEECQGSRPAPYINPNDIAVGLLLVKASQLARKAAGHEFLWSAEYEPDWDEDLHLSAAQDTSPQRDLVYPQQKDTAGRSGKSTRPPGMILGQQQHMDGAFLCPPDERRRHSGKHSSRRSDRGPDLEADGNLRSLPPDDDPNDVGQPLIESQHHHQQQQHQQQKQKHRIHQKPDSFLLQDDPAQMSLNHLQPRLSQNDLRRLRFAQHYQKYAIAIYGWMLKTFTHPCSFLGLCGPCAGVGQTLQPGQAEMFVGSGCCGRLGCSGQGPLTCSCCHWDVNTFCKEAGLPIGDVLYAKIGNRLHQPVYLVCADHPKKVLVIAIRGTMSLHDAITDLDALPKTMEAFGFPGASAHAGMLESLEWLLRDIERRRVVENFLRNHPDYDVVITGHSLGAAMSTMLSLVLARFHPQFEDFQIPSEEATPDTLLLHPSSDGTDPAPADQDRGQAGRAQEAPLREEHPEREVAAAAVAAASSSSSSSSSATVGLGDSVVSIDIPDEDASPVAGSSPLGKDGLTDLDTDPESTAAAVEEVKEDTPPGLEPPLQAAPRLTRFIRERGVVIRCVALAPPMIVSRNLAQSRLALTVVTSIVYGHDMVCRLSLRNVWLLKEQMIQGFRRMARGTSRWQAWRYNMKRRHSALLLPERQAQILQEQASPNRGSTSAAAAAAAPFSPSHSSSSSSSSSSSAAAAAAAATFGDPDSSSSPPPPGGRERGMISTDPGASGAHPDTTFRVRRPSFLTPRVCDQHLAGRIYHFNPDRRRRRGNLCSNLFCHSCCGPEYPNTVFRAHPDAYQELLVDRAMFQDHMPYVYEKLFEELDETLACM